MSGLDRVVRSLSALVNIELKDFNRFSLQLSFILEWELGKILTKV